MASSGDVTIYRIPFSSIVRDDEIQQIEADLSRAIEQSSAPVRLALDFSRTFFVSSRALGLLVALRRRVVEKGGRLVLFGLNPAIEKVMQVTQVDTLIPVVGGEAQATAILCEGGSV